MSYKDMEWLHFGREAKTKLAEAQKQIKACLELMSVAGYRVGGGASGGGFSTYNTVEPIYAPLPEEHIVAAIVGYRAWNVPLFVDEMRSMTGQVGAWPVRERFEARCIAPMCTGLRCNCGIHAFKDLGRVRRTYSGVTDTYNGRVYGPPSSHPITTVYGSASLWGRVVEFTEGYRAQFAYPKEILDTGALARRIAEVYGVPMMKAE